MLLKVSNVNFNNSNHYNSYSTSMKGRYSGIPNFHPRYKLNPPQSFFTKVVKFIKALYNANFNKKNLI